MRLQGGLVQVKCPFGMSRRRTVYFGAQPRRSRGSGMQRVFDGVPTGTGVCAEKYFVNDRVLCALALSLRYLC